MVPNMTWKACDLNLVMNLHWLQNAKTYPPFFIPAPCKICKYAFYLLVKQATRAKHFELECITYEGNVTHEKNCNNLMIYMKKTVQSE